MAFEMTSNKSEWMRQVVTVKVKPDHSMAKVTTWISDTKMGESFMIDGDKLPEFPKNFLGDGHKWLMIYTLKKGKLDKIDAVFPIRLGKEMAKLTDMTRNRDTNLPSPYTVGKSKYDNSDVLKFNMFYTFVDKESPYFGCVLQVGYFYKFADNGYGEVTILGKGAASKALQNDTNELGMADSPMSFPEDGNVLPALLARAIDANRTVEISGRIGLKDDGSYGTWFHADPIMRAYEAPKVPTQEKEDEWVEEVEDEEKLPDFLKDDDKDDWE